MGNHKVKSADVVAAGVASGNQSDHSAKAPSFVADFECIGADGLPRWKAHWANQVVDAGKGHLINRFFGGATASSQGPFLALHSATTASNHVWSNISASQVGSYGANVPLITFPTNNVVGSATATASYGFTAGTQTVSGAAILFHTTNTLSTNAATANILEYSEGQFGGSRQVQNLDTLNVTVTVSFA